MHSMLQSDKYKSKASIREGIEKICVWAWAGVEMVGQGKLQER